MNEDLLKTIQEMMPRFSKSQKLIGGYILEHYEKAAYMTALRLGNAVNVSESTVVRFANKLGFEGYPELQRSLQHHIKNRLTSIQRMDVTRSRIGDSDPIEGVMGQDMNKIRRTMESVDHERFAQAVRRISEAGRIYIQGAMSSGILASFMYYYMRVVHEDVRLVGSVGTSEMYQQMVHLEKNDLLIVMSFPRYAKSTVEACRFAQECGAQIIAITDSDNSPIAEYADVTLCAYSDMISFVDSLVAPMSLIDALIVAVAGENRTDMEEKFQRLESLWDRNGVYKKDE